MPPAALTNRAGVLRPDVIVIRLNPSLTSIADINAEYGTHTLDSIDDLPGVYLLRVPPNTDAARVISRLSGDKRVIFAELDSISQPPVAHPRSISVWSGVDAEVYIDQAAADELDLEDAHAITRGTDSMVAVLDTGVQADHPALRGRVLSGHDFVDNDGDASDTANGVDDDGDGMIDDAYGHGTHVAGIVHLVAPDAAILPVRVMDSDGNGYVFTVAKAVVWAARQGANVINLSLGTPQPSRLLQDALAEARRAGVVLVAAAGNVDWLDKQYPAADSSVLAITSVNDDCEKSSFANYGEWVDLSAPGENIISTYPGGGYALWSGTSMAAPFAAGQAALIRSAAPDWGVDPVVSTMLLSATPLRERDPRYWPLLGNGMIDITRSVQRAQARQLLTRQSAK